MSSIAMIWPIVAIETPHACLLLYLYYETYTILFALTYIIIYRSNHGKNKIT